MVTARQLHNNNNNNNNKIDIHSYKKKGKNNTPDMLTKCSVSGSVPREVCDYPHNFEIWMSIMPVLSWIVVEQEEHEEQEQERVRKGNREDREEKEKGNVFISFL